MIEKPRDDGIAEAGGVGKYWDKFSNIPPPSSSEFENCSAFTRSSKFEIFLRCISLWWCTFWGDKNTWEINVIYSYQWFENVSYINLMFSLYLVHCSSDFWIDGKISFKTIW